MCIMLWKWHFLRDVIHFAFVRLKALVDISSDHIFRLLHFRSVKRSLPPISESFLTESAISLAKKIRQRKLTSEALVQSCIDRIVEIQHILNVVVDQRFAAALEDAKRVDRILTSLSPAARRQLEGDLPLIGVPFSAQEGIKIKGLRHSLGLQGRIEAVADEDSPSVYLLKEAGAIPLCMTNASELGFWWESYNTLYGVTSNPFSQVHTAGGSSGGGAALQSIAGIPISIGLDIAGSIGTPAAFCGVFAHKATSGWIAHQDATNLPTMSSVGPISRHAEDLLPLLKVLASEIDLPQRKSLDQAVQLTKLKYFYLVDGIGNDALVSAVCPEMRQSMFRVINYMEDNFGIEFYPLKLDSMKQALTLFFYYLDQEWNQHQKVPLYEIALGKLAESRHSLLKEWARWLFREGTVTLPLLLLLTWQKLRSSVGNRLFNSDLLRIQMQTLQNEFCDRLGENGVLICPAHPTSPPYHGQAWTRPFNFIFTAVFNILGVPSTVVPLGLNQEGLPIGIQVVSSRNNDKITLTVARELERPFGGWNSPFNTTFVY